MGSRTSLPAWSLNDRNLLFAFEVSCTSPTAVSSTVSGNVKLWREGAQPEVIRAIRAIWCSGSASHHNPR